MTGRRVIPIGWCIGRACAWLSEEAHSAGGPVAGRFNWVDVVARPGLKPQELAAQYAEAAVRRMASTAELDNTICPTVRASNAAFAKRMAAVRIHAREVAA